MQAQQQHQWQPRRSCCNVWRYLPFDKEALETSYWIEMLPRRRHSDNVVISNRNSDNALPCAFGFFFGYNNLIGAAMREKQQDDDDGIE